MCTGRANFDVTMARADFDVTMGRLQTQGYFHGVYCNIVDHRFYIITLQHYRPLLLHNLWYCKTYSKHPGKTLILQLPTSLFITKLISLQLKLTLYKIILVSF